MSLLDEAMDDCTMLDRYTVNDGYGVVNKYREGALFKCATTLDTSTEARIAQQQGVKNLYTATTNKGTNLQFHDVFKRNRDNKIFRVTSDGDDKKTPSSATLDMRIVSCEEYVLPANSMEV